MPNYLLRNSNRNHSNLLIKAEKPDMHLIARSGVYLHLAFSLQSQVFAGAKRRDKWCEMMLISWHLQGPHSGTLLGHSRYCLNDRPKKSQRILLGPKTVR